MAGEDRVLAGGAKYIDFQTDPQRYRHWKLGVEGDVATLTMDVDENCRPVRGLSAQAELPTISASTSSSPMPCSGSVSSIPK
jgi:hypothetical protein